MSAIVPAIQLITGERIRFAPGLPVDIVVAVVQQGRGSKRMRLHLRDEASGMVHVHSMKTTAPVVVLGREN